MALTHDVTDARRTASLSKPYQLRQTHQRAASCTKVSPHIHTNGTATHTYTNARPHAQCGSHYGHQQPQAGRGRDGDVRSSTIRQATAGGPGRRKHGKAGAPSSKPPGARRQPATTQTPDLLGGGNRPGRVKDAGGITRVRHMVLLLNRLTKFWKRCPISK